MDRKVVTKDQAGYYRRWPWRDFTLLGEPSLVSMNGERATVRFRLRYAVSSAREHAGGTTENVLHLSQTDDGAKIIGIHERKVRE